MYYRRREQRPEMLLVWLGGGVFLLACLMWSVRAGIAAVIETLFTLYRTPDRREA